MHAEEHELEALLNIQRIDLSILQAKKKRSELPQRITVVKLRKKRGEVIDKLSQLVEIQSKVEAQLTEVEDEDRSLAEKQDRAQEIIDTAGSDFRKVESHSKEMAGMAKRRETLAERMLEITGKLDEVKAVRAQLESAISASEAEERRVKESYEDEDNALVGQVRGLMEQRAQIVAGLPADLVDVYERTAAKAGGVAVGKLDGDTCGVCRSLIDGGRLIEVRSQAPLATCPNCKRLLVVE